MHVTVHLAPDAAHGFESGRADPALTDLLDELGTSLRPLHPGTDDPELARHFFADLPTEAEARELCTRLRGHPDVAAAYVKPEEGPPSAP